MHFKAMVKEGTNGNVARANKRSFKPFFSNLLNEPGNNVGSSPKR